MSTETLKDDKLNTIIYANVRQGVFTIAEVAAIYAMRDVLDAILAGKPIDKEELISRYGTQVLAGVGKLAKVN